MDALFRRGGWAIQLDCENPTLVSWLQQLEKLRQAVCTLVGVKCDNRFVLQDSCQQWTPMAIGATAGFCLIVVLCFSFFAATSLAENLVRWVAGRGPTRTPPACLPRGKTFPSAPGPPENACTPPCPAAGGGSGPAAAALQTPSGPPQRRARSCAGRSPSATRPRRTPGTSCGGRARRRRSSARPCCVRSASAAPTQRARWGQRRRPHVLVVAFPCQCSHCCNLLQQAGQARLF